MGKGAAIEDDLRARIISQPDVILEDIDVMRALVSANERARGANVVDLRSVAMERLEARLDRLEDTHRSVIAAAYENLASTNQVHRAILRMLDSDDFETFLHDLGGEVADILRVDTLRLVLETEREDDDDPALRKLGDVLCTAEPGFVDAYIETGRDRAGRQVTLRKRDRDDARIFGDRASWVRSEACLRLDLGTGRLPGMLALGSEDAERFSPTHGTDLLSFFASVFERTMRRWLS
ncbi:DUF484 family protein [Tranquillimonas alkanivorans]|uniref:Recombinase XerC n=1 Tax=Tranquillimonas alkanivorans TaxID=441119 RepID=A0A1I5N819_9RHOB|nr:DUF484 family protein [Tranquillimonas alkanivorans]SFP17837.1 hypothetical protein SAMN04488047_103142 [Tranquillimonas alkanivorans]